MKISKQTLNLLNSFVMYNPSIRIKKGCIITTTNVGKDGVRTVPIKNVLVRAEVAETFEKEFNIFDLKQFLNIINTFTDPDFDFQDTHVVISEKNNSIKYSYCDPIVVVSPKKDSYNIDDVLEEIIVDSALLNKIKKISSVMKHDDLFIRSSEGGTLRLVLTTCIEGRGENENEYVFDTEKECTKDFEFKFSMKNISSIISTTDEYSLKIGLKDEMSMIVFEGLGDTKIIYYIGSKL